MSTETTTLSESAEMYLIVIYRLTQNQASASTTEIAARLAISQPSVTEQLKRLHSRGYVNYEWREGASLTPVGLKIALATLRKHRLVESFLVNLMGYGLDEVHEEACRLEHYISDRLADGLEKLLSFPQFDPHGHPIPTWTGEIAATNQRPLSTTEPGQRVLVSQVADWEPHALRYLLDRGLKPGTALTVLDRVPNQGPVLVQVSDQTVAITFALAKEVKVTPVPEER
ncbi:MAG TPA: metal-dependent transcriptional regulator [Anaerolineae bacterium]|nr:metal-dependent transcriptional regulator [Anaerolineae bacterium]HMR66689.1 metal-dependent transcriptional regulator [Anaerolineae bacterium]